MNFVKIRNYSRYMINSSCTVKNIHTGKVLEGAINNSGYLNYRLTRDDGLTVTWGAHRLLAWVFQADFGDITGLVVNHIDGDKLNNDLANLEIVTYQENAEHAGLHGLTTKCKPVSVRDVISGEVYKYPSINSLSREIGLSKDVVASRCLKGEFTVFTDQRQYKFGHDDFTYKPRVNKLNALMDRGRAIPVIIRNVMTNEFNEFNYSREASEFLGCSVAAISQWLNNPDQPIIRGFYQIQKLRSMKDWVDHEDIVLRYELDNNVRCVYTWDQDGELTLHFSARDAARYLGIKTTTLDYRLKSKGLTKFKDGTRCAYYSEWSPHVETHEG